MQQRKRSMPLPLLLAEPVTQSLRLSMTEKAPENYTVFAEKLRRTACSILVLYQWQCASKFCMSPRRCRTKCSMHFCQPVHLRQFLCSRKCGASLKNRTKDFIQSFIYSNVTRVKYQGLKY